MRIIRFRNNRGEKMLECMQKGLKHFNKALEYVEDAMEDSLDKRDNDDWEDEEDDYRSSYRGGGMSGSRGRGRYARN